MATDTGKRHWHCLGSEAAAAHLDSDLNTGLAAEVAASRLEQLGPNVLHEAARRHPLAMLASQFTDFMILVLIAAAIIAGVIGEPQDSIAIVVIVFLNGIIGFVQEYRAERAMAALKQMASPQARVIRDGRSALIDATALVPGDLVELEAGNILPADLRLTELASLKVDESALTGESQPVEKQLAPLHDIDLPLGDRLNLAYKGTIVTYARARLGGGYRHADRTGENRRAAVGGIRQDAAAETAGALRPASCAGGAGDLRHHFRGRLAARRAAPADAAHRGQPRCRRHSRSTACRRHHLACAGRGAHG